MRLLSLLLLAISMLSANIELPENFQADFTQKITNTKEKVITYSGKVRFSNETLFKWSYKEPTQKEVCTNGLELIVVDHDLEQVSAYRIAKGIDISKILKQAKPHSENIYVAEYENKLYTIQIDNKQKLHSIAYFDDLDNKVQIVFKRMKYGKRNLPAQSMKCNYPKNYDMIRG
ncbi:MAG: outer-membrane lipoprotein carrier protein LolA [Sulfurovum sp.]|uniref:LolA-like outer membrane lipoprotein chaperone n=1 Tax=Sulfurovum sp. TaxID=1969726 RepID=UPI0028682D1D|nr:LolA-like outer membrane lipoprotein chaperone [Sulfurovum sp.]MCO4845537.1 outer-membrane lipoprotein carrier protein LolA [Sulfurovum sp.]